MRSWCIGGVVLVYMSMAVLYTASLPIPETFENLGWFGRLHRFFGSYTPGSGPGGGRNGQKWGLGVYDLSFFGHIHQVSGPFCPPGLIWGPLGILVYTIFRFRTRVEMTEKGLECERFSLFAQFHQVSIPSGVMFTRFLSLLSCLFLDFGCSLRTRYNIFVLIKKHRDALHTWCPCGGLQLCHPNLSNRAIVRNVDINALFAWVWSQMTSFIFEISALCQRQPGVYMEFSQ